MAQQFTTDHPTFDEIQTLRKPRTRTEWIPLDGDVLAEIERLDAELRIAERDDEKLNRIPEAPTIRRELDAVRQRAETAAVRFTATALPRKRYRELIAANPPVDGDTKKRWELDTFAPALISACITEPAGVDGQALWDEWEAGIAETIFGMALVVNEDAPRVPTGARSTERVADSEPSSTTAAPEG